MVFCSQIICALIHICGLHREGFCVLLMLLPGDSPSFEFGKPEWTNRLFVVAVAHQSAADLGLVWVGRSSIFTIPIYLSSPDSRGWG